MSAEAEATLASARGYHVEVTLPWEDAFLGMALSRVATGPRLAMVSIGHEAFTDVKRKRAEEHGVPASLKCAWTSVMTAPRRPIAASTGSGPVP